MRDKWVPPDGEPADVVTGPDPRVVAGIRVANVAAVRLSCPACTYSVLVPRVEADQTIDVLEVPRMSEHVHVAHPANRSDDLTCHARALWDHERWCVRAKGHDDLGHWTPSFGGGRWWPVQNPTPIPSVKR